MAVTTKQSISKLAKQVCDDFSQYTFVQGDDFVWSPQQQQITYSALLQPEDVWDLLHEISHAELGHTDYTLDVELVRREAEAWHHAVNTLAPHYHLIISPDYTEDHLDTYRVWLHKRSLCPSCTQNGLQTTTNTYSCNNCRCSWRVNEARKCGLRRTRLPNQDQI
jgi:hypothetical protein